VTAVPAGTLVAGSPRIDGRPRAIGIGVVAGGGTPPLRLPFRLCRCGGGEWKRQGVGTILIAPRLFPFQLLCVCLLRNNRR